MINETNIYEKGMLIVLNEKGYSGRMKLSQEEIKEAGLPSDIVRAVHDLFDRGFKEKLDAIGLFDNNTRSYVKSFSVAFPIKAVYFLRYDHIDRIVEYIESRKALRVEMVEDLVENYDQAITEFAEKFPKYYRKAQHKYPSKRDFASRFSFDYQFVQVAPPSENTKLTSDQYRRAQTQFTETINAVKKDVVNTIYTELAELTIRLKRQSKDGKMNQRTFNSLSEYFTKINDIYSEFVDRQDLVEAINKIKTQVLGASADMLRDNDGQRKKFHKAISESLSEMQALPDIELKRALEF
jgi:hypothetical protein